ncbi:MAG TPA: nicotinate-nucleotide diphosphorylase (carboxylating), partial [Methylotenera mobilis]|nr:nicotinate-nucleotide diphosphorylase (carboxylating) [Methylotenera mobilis]
QEALEAGATSILLDNFSLDLLHEAVRLNNSAVKKAILEASGGITLNNVHEVAKTGVDRISIGAITKDINAIDLSMQIIPNT